MTDQDLTLRCENCNTQLPENVPLRGDIEVPCPNPDCTNVYDGISLRALNEKVVHGDAHADQAG
jgi:hypothetical protein